MTNDKLIGYTVVQEFGAPYWTADLKYEGSSILQDDPTLEGYFELHQTDTTTDETRMIFAGFPIKFSWKIKKGIIQYTVRAVTNGWYLTQQNVPQGASGSECVHHSVVANGDKYDVTKYARRNGEMLIWDYLFNAAPTDVMHASYCSDVKQLDDNENVSADMASVTMANFPLGNQNALCGIYASDEMIADRACTGSQDWDCSDCQNHSSGSDYWGDGRRDWSFNYKTKTKFSAITDISEYCDHVFYFRIEESTGNNNAYWTPNASVNANSVEPFSTLLTIDTNNDDSLVDLKKHEHFTERGTPNTVYAYSQSAGGYWDRDGEGFVGVYPQEWYTTNRPVIDTRQQNDYTQAEIDTYAQSTYDSIHGEEGNRYTANLVSTIMERSGGKLLGPGSRIRILGIDADLIDPDTEYRIMKITHRKDGGKPATTAIEFSKATELAHPMHIPTSVVSEVVATEIKKQTVDKEKNEPEDTILEPVLIQSIENGFATVTVLNTNKQYKNVIHLR